MLLINPPVSLWARFTLPVVTVEAFSSCFALGRQPAMQPNARSTSATVRFVIRFVLPDSLTLLVPWTPIKAAACRIGGDIRVMQLIMLFGALHRPDATLSGHDIGTFCITTDTRHVICRKPDRYPQVRLP